MSSPGVYNPPNAHYSEIDVPSYIDMGLFIGKGGKYFKNITYKVGCSYIWYNKDRRVIEIWGPEWSIANAMNMCMERFEKFKPELTLDDLSEIVTVTATYTRENGNDIHELEGPEWAVKDFCSKKFENSHIEEIHLIGENKFWTKVVLFQ